MYFLHATVALLATAVTSMAACCAAPQVVLGLGVAAASLYGLHQLLAPRLTAWTHQLTASRRAAQDAEAARSAALTAALQSLSEGQQKLLESVQGLTATLQQQQQRPGSSQAVRGMGASAAYGGPGEAQSSISFHQHRGAADEAARCQSPSAAAAASGVGSSQRQQQQQQQYSSNARGWDPYADPSRGAAIRSSGYSGPGYSSASNYSQPQQLQQEGAASSVGGGAAGPGAGFEVVPRGSQPASEAMWGASSSTGPAPAGTAAGAVPGHAPAAAVLVAACR
jgi:hypothetical protein